MSGFKKYILFVGMGDWCLPQLEIAKQKGYKTIVTNRDKNAVALEKADVPIVADGCDASAILSFLCQKQIENEITYIYTGTELFFPVALIAQSLNIPWHSPLSAYICENKSLMREKFKQHNVLHPSGCSAKSSTELISKVQYKKGKKYVIKPSNSLSSQGITIVSSERELKDAFNRAVQYATSKTVVCEEYVEGLLHDTNGILTEGRLIRLGINDKKAGPLPHTVVIEGSCPTILSKSLQEEIYSIFEKACRAVGLTHGPVKGDFIVDGENNVFVLEVAPRLHGPLGSLYLIPNALEINPFEGLLNWFDKGEGNVKEHYSSHHVSETVFATACDLIENFKKKGMVLNILEKSGISDRKLWKSNYDVPIYVIWKQ